MPLVPVGRRGLGVEPHPFLSSGPLHCSAREEDHQYQAMSMSVCVCVCVCVWVYESTVYMYY